MSVPPSQMGNFMASGFQILLGTWLLLPQDSFGPTLFPTDLVFSSLTEPEFGALFVIMGIVQSYFVYKEKWAALGHFSLFGTMVWTFVTIGYYLSLPTSTNIVIFSFYAAYNAYVYVYMRFYCKYYLPNNEKVGNI